MKIAKILAASMLVVVPALVATSADARSHTKRHRTHMMKRGNATGSGPGMPGTAATPQQRMNAPASPVGGPVGSGKP